MSLPPEVSLVLFLPSTWAAITCGSFLRESSAELFRLVPDGTGTAFDDIEPVFQVPEADPRCRETVFRETNMSYKQHDVIRYFLPSSSDRLAYMHHAVMRSFRSHVALWNIVLSYDRIDTAIAKSSLGAYAKMAASLQKLGDMTKTCRAPASEAVNKGKVTFINTFEWLH